MVSSERHTRARLIVCEREGRWAAALRRETAGTGVRIWETRSVPECCEEAAISPASFVVLEVQGNLLEAMRFISWQRRAAPLVRWAATVSRELAACESLLREAGAVHVVTSPRRLWLLVQTACRHLERFEQPQSVTGDIWVSLSWAEDPPPSTIECE